MNQEKQIAHGFIADIEVACVEAQMRSLRSRLVVLAAAAGAFLAQRHEALETVPVTAAAVGAIVVAEAAKAFDHTMARETGNERVLGFLSWRQGAGKPPSSPVGIEPEAEDFTKYEEPFLAPAPNFIRDSYTPNNCLDAMAAKASVPVLAAGAGAMDGTHTSLPMLCFAGIAYQAGKKFDEANDSVTVQASNQAIQDIKRMHHDTV